MPQPAGNNLRSVRYLDGRYVAVGSMGSILVSDDAAAWNLVRVGGSTWIGSIGYGNEKFILRSGANKTVPVPNQPLATLLIAEKRAAGKPMITRVDSKAGPNDPKRFFPFPWTKPNKPNKP